LMKPALRRHERLLRRLERRTKPSSLFNFFYFKKYRRSSAKNLYIERFVS
jgi:hypothetical protein